jgi:hypothetical protein
MLVRTDTATASRWTCSSGASPYDVAKLLGDTVATIEKRYAPFEKELRDRARQFTDNGEGLEKTRCSIVTRPTGTTTWKH